MEDFFFSFATSGASNFKHSFAFHEPVLDLACLCDSFLVESPILYLPYFKSILAALFRTFGLPLRFLPSKPSLFHDHFTTQHSDFPSFLVALTTDKPVNRSIHDLCSHVEERFGEKGVYLSWYSQNTSNEFEQFGLQYTKNIWLENTLAHTHLWRGSTQIEYSSQKIAQQEWN